MFLVAGEMMDDKWEWGRTLRVGWKGFSTLLDIVNVFHAKVGPARPGVPSC